MPEIKKISRAPLLYDGSFQLSPAQTESGDNSSSDAQYHVVLEGTFTFAPTGETFDALYRYGTAGEAASPSPPLRHDYVKWTPAAPVVVSEDRGGHRYVFRIPNEAITSGQSVGAGIDVDRFVNQYLLPPSEVRQALSGHLQISVQQTVIPSPFPWKRCGAIGLPAALIVGGVGWTVYRRRLFLGLPDDLQETLGRILDKARRARTAVARQDARLLPRLRARLNALADGAASVARQTAQVRSARRQVPEQSEIEADIRALSHRLDVLTANAGQRSAEDTAPYQETQATLSEKRKTLARLNELAQAETHGLLRLAKIEAALEATIISLRAAAVGSPDTAAPFSDEALRRMLDAEVAALRETARARATAFP